MSRPSAATMATAQTVIQIAKGKAVRSVMASPQDSGVAQFVDQLELMEQQELGGLE
jgi:NADPH-dependent curcumin reductase CurA